MSAARRLLLGADMAPAFITALAQRCRLTGPLAPPFEQAVRALDGDVRAEVEACVTLGGMPFGAASMDALPRLRWIGCFGSGYEGVDVPAARARGIAITHSPGANAASVADLAIGLMIASVRRMRAGRLRLDAGSWQGTARERTAPVRGLTGRRVGIYGLGEIGLRIARRAAALETQIGYHNRRPREDVAYRWFPTLLDLARFADVLMIAVRADASNRHAVNADVLAALGADGHLVNVARGFVVDEAALVHALERGVIAGAGLDVYEREPHVPAALLALPNVTLTPHLGGATVEAREAMEAMVLANLDAFLAGRALPTPVPA